MRISFDLDGTLREHFNGEDNPEQEELRELCKKLIGDGHEVFIITRRFSPEKCNEGIKNEHVDAYIVAEEIGVKKENVYFMSRHWKFSKVKKLKIDVHIDDDPVDCKHIEIDASNKCVPICLDSNYNPLKKTWKEMVEILIKK